MAQDQKKALDEKTKKLSSGKIEEGKEHAAYQESQQQLLAIQAEQQQNLAVARAESKASFENNQTLAQAAELGAISAAEAEQAAAAGAQAGVQLNPATQQVLSKYGVGQPTFKRTQSHSQQVTKQNITINNNITSNTTNDVKVPANIGGPLQGRPLQFKDPTVVEGSTGKFKTWISSAFSRQNEEGAKRDREYRNRESSLTKSANRMMRKLEDIGKTIGTRMDPRKIGSTWQSQLKTLLFLFGFGYLTSNWTKILAQIASIETWFKEDFAKFLGIGSYSNEESGLKKTIRSILGGSKGEGLIESLGKLLFIGDESLLGYIKTYLGEKISDRGRAMKMIKFPEIDLSDLVGTIKGIAFYLGDLLNAMVSGSEGVRSHINNQIKTTANSGAFEQAKKDSKTMSTVTEKTISGKQIDADSGIGAIIKGEYKGLTRHSLDSDGNLTTKYGAEASVAQASDINRLFLQANNGGSINSTELAAGVERLYRASQSSENGVPVTKDFLTKWFTAKELGDMLKKGEIKNQQYYVVARKKTNEDNLLEDTSLTNRFAKEYTEKTLGDAARKATGNKDSFLGNLFGGYQIANATGRTTRTLYNKAVDNDYRIEYVKTPRDGDEILDDGKGGPKKSYFVEIKPQVIQKIADRITGKEGTNIDITNRDFVTSVQTGLVDSAKNALKEEIDIREKYRKTHKTDFDNNTKLVGLRNRRSELFATDAAKIDYNLDQAFKDLDNLTIQEQESNEKIDNAWGKTRAYKAGENISSMTYDFSNGRFGTHTETLSAGKSVDSQELKYRKQYLLKLFKDKGLSDGAAAGIIGNLEGEGLGKETDWNHRVPDPPGSGRYSMGIAQFNTKGELPNLQAWAKQKGLNYNTFETQAQYIAEHPVTQKIFKETEGLAPQDSLRKSAIIWGHDFERFKGHDAADSKGNLIGKGQYISVTANKRDKYRSDGKFYGDENYTERIQKGLNTYNTYVGTDLSSIKLQSSRSFEQENENTAGEKKGEAKSFLEIFKEKISDLITNFGGAFSTVNDKVEKTVSPVVEEIKNKVFPKERPSYTGPITKEFKSYQDYKANEDNLPADLPKGMTETEWRRKIFDLTGSSPIDLELTETKKELREDSEEILKKYSTESNREAEDERYRKMISYLDDPTLRSTLTANEISNIERVKRQDEIGKEPNLKEEVLNDPNKYRQMAKLIKDNPNYKDSLTEDNLNKVRIIQEMDDNLPATTFNIEDEEKDRLMDLAKYPKTRGKLSQEDLVKVQRIEEAEGKAIEKTTTAVLAEDDKNKPESSNFLSIIDPENFKKKGDQIKDVIEYLVRLDNNVYKILDVTSINGVTSAHIVDAVNQGTVASTNASRNLARISIAQQNNTVGKDPSLEGSKNAINGIA